MSKADVAQFKTTVDTFAASYTSGADAAKDSAAVSALEAGMQTLLSNIWSETHVVSKDALTKLQQSVGSFVSSYTGGTNAAQDASAWSALQSGLNDFWTSVSASGSTTNVTPMPMPMPMPLPLMPLPMMLPNAIVAGSGAGMIAPASASGVFSGASMITSAAASVSGAGTTVSDVTSPDFMLAQPTISKDDVTKLQQAIDAFAAAYTSGTDPAADKTAVSNLESSLSSLAQNWKPPTATPAPFPATLPPGPTAPPASTVTTATASTAAPSTSTVSTAPASTAAPSTSTVSTAPASTAAPSTSAVSTVPISTITTSPPPPGPIQPDLPPGAFVSMPIASLAAWIPGIGKPIGAPVIVGR